MHRFTADASASLGGPEWLASRRESSYERLSASAFPSESEEVWRYSGIDDFDLERFRPPEASGDVPGAAYLASARRLADQVGPRSALVVTFNGRVAALESDEAEDGAAALSLGRAGDLSDGSGDVPGRLGALAPARDAFGELHDAFVPDVTVVNVAAKGRLTAPVVVVHLVSDERGAPSTMASAFPHTLVRLGTSSEAGVVEISAGSSAALVVPVTELEVEDGANLQYANVQVLARGCLQVATQASRVARDAALRSFTVALGGTYARVRTDSDLVGQGGSTSLLAAYLGTDDQVLDFRTLQDHHAPRTDSELLFEGAVAGSSRSVYSGLIRIRKGARSSNAFQTNRNLVLSEGAHADSVPNLDIDENDVRCSHASTVGPIDEEQLYYLESRGIEPEVAQRLIVEGFFSDIARRAPFAEVGTWVERAVSERLRDEAVEV